MTRDSTTPPRAPEPFRHVFVATDFSKGAERAVARAAKLPIADDGKITLLHVLPEAPPSKARAAAEDTARHELGEATRALAQSISARGRRDVQLAADSCRGQPYVEVIRHARTAGADLLVLGRHGHRPIKDMFIGSTAERVIRAGDLPALVVHGPAKEPYHRPLFAVDLGDHSRSQVVDGLRVLGPEASSAALVHAYQVPFEGFLAPGAAGGTTTELRKEYKRAAAAKMETLVGSLEELETSWETKIAHGDARKVILVEIARRGADLLVVGSHGRAGLSLALLGSVSEWVTRAATCDVLVARPTRVSFPLP